MLIKTLLLLVVLSVVATAKDTRETPDEILTERSFIREDGYDFEYKTSDGVSRQEHGELLDLGDRKAIGVRGSYSYLGPDGQQYLVTFVADDKGYRPELHIVQSKKNK